MIAVSQLITADRDRAIDAAIAAGNVDGAFLAVRQAELRMAKMHKLCLDASWNKDSSRIIPLFLKGGADILERRWTSYLSIVLAE